MEPQTRRQTRQSRPGRIRPALASEADHLTGLAIRSKAHWGYDASFMEACVPALTVSPERLATEHYFVLEEDGQVVGFAGLHVDGPDAELTNLFCEPRVIGRGYGKQLWRHAVEVARSRGAARLRIESDPYAEAFYVAMGAQHIGEAPSDAIPGRMIPLLTFNLLGTTGRCTPGAQ